MKKCSAFVLAALLVSGSAFAETKEEIEIRNAQTRFEEGLSLADQGQHEEARVKFVQAYAVLKSTKVLYNLAIAEKKTSHPVECIQHFRVFLKDPTITPDLRARAEQIIAELSKTTSRVEIAATPGADVRIDGVTVGRTPFTDPVDVAVGHHTVSATLDANNKTTEVDTTAGGLAKVDVAFPNYQPALQTQANPARIAIPVGLGIGAVAGFAIGIGFGAASGSTSDEVIAHAGTQPCYIQTSVACDEHQKMISKGETQRTVSWIGYVAGGALAVAAVVTFFILPKRIPVQPKVGMGFVGLDFETEF